MSQSAAMNVIKTHKIGGSGQSQTKSTTKTSTSHSSTSSSVRPNDSKPTNASTNQTVKTSQSESGKSIVNGEEHTENVSSQDRVFDEYVTARPKQRLSNVYPGRPQLQKFSSQSSMRGDADSESKIEKFKLLHDEAQLNLSALREISWSGIPRKMRAITWRLLSGYLPTSRERRDSILENKRLNYFNLVEQYFKAESRDEAQQDTYRQIHIDMPRMNPHIHLFQQTLVQEMFERILFIWAIRHPASGYVQGINDLVTPFFIVFLHEAFDADDSTVDLNTFKLDSLTKEQLNIIEADSFWCLSKFLDCIQDNYIFAQLGIQAKVNQLKELIQRIDGELMVLSLTSNGIHSFLF